MKTSKKRLKLCSICGKVAGNSTVFQSSQSRTTVRLCQKCKRLAANIPSFDGGDESKRYMILKAIIATKFGIPTTDEKCSIRALRLLDVMKQIDMAELAL